MARPFVSSADLAEKPQAAVLADGVSALTGEGYPNLARSRARTSWSVSSRSPVTKFPDITLDIYICPHPRSPRQFLDISPSQTLPSFLF